MQDEILIALLSKLVDEKLGSLPIVHGPRGLRGATGVPGINGRDFVFADHESNIKAWTKEFALKFQDLSADDIASLRGPRGVDGRDFVFADHADIIRGYAQECALKFADLSLDEIESLRGPRGLAGADGRGFVFVEHEEQIKSWAKEFALKFQDLSAEEISALRGPKGRDGRDGQDGKAGADFVFADHEARIKSWAKEFALKFHDLTTEEQESLRGPRGLRGQRGEGGKDFIFADHIADIEAILRSEIHKASEYLKLKFADLSADDIEALRGPRGRDGRDGKGFVFDEHLEFFKSLKLKFSDLTDEERESLVLKFSSLSNEEKDSLKLRFADLTDEDRFSLRGPRGVRGQKGQPGRDGEDGQSIRGLPGPTGLSGRPGIRGINGVDGVDGLDGRDAAWVTDIRLETVGNKLFMVFTFSDATEIETNRVELPGKPTTFIAPSPYMGGGADGKSAYQSWLKLGNTGTETDFINYLRMPMFYDTRIDEASDSTTYIGKAATGSSDSEPVWQIKRITISGVETSIEWADGSAGFDQVWDDRAGLSYS